MRTVILSDEKCSAKLAIEHFDNGDKQVVISNDLGEKITFPADAQHLGELSVLISKAITELRSIICICTAGQEYMNPSEDVWDSVLRKMPDEASRANP